jgi:hypothetical protein
MKALKVDADGNVAVDETVEEDDDPFAEVEEDAPKPDLAAVTAALQAVAGTAPAAVPAQPDTPAVPAPAQVVPVPVYEPSRVGVSTEPAGTRLIVDLTDMPDADQWNRFGQMVIGRPGPTTVLVRTPQGELPLTATTNLGPADGGSISMLFGGARVFYDAATVDSSKVLEGLQL